MSRFNPQTYPAAVAALVEGNRLNSLGPGTPGVDSRQALAALDVDTLLGPRSLADRSMARSCLAGLWLLHDFLDESHRISQEIETPTGSYWHGIMHRREPDYENSKYWFRRVGEHPTFAALGEAAHELAAESGEAGKPLGASETWDPFHFVDLCRQAHRGGPLESLCQRIQRVEWELLFDHSYRHAIDG